MSGDSSSVQLKTVYAASQSGAGNMKLWTASVAFPLATRGKLQGEEDQELKTDVAARGIVLFIHGFAQLPIEYMRLLDVIAKVNEVLVIAPCPRSSSTPEGQQRSLVDAALFWRECIDANKIPGIGLVNDGNRHVSLLGHSIGGGLAPYIVDTAARKGRPFMMAYALEPKTDVAVDYRFDIAQGMLDGVPTKWGLQYSMFDLLLPLRSTAILLGFLNSKDKLMYNSERRQWLELQRLLSQGGPVILFLSLGFYSLLPGAMSLAAHALPGGTYDSFGEGLVSVLQIGLYIVAAGLWLPLVIYLAALVTPPIKPDADEVEKDVLAFFRHNW